MKEAITILRDRTGAGLMECQKALNKANGDILLAEGYMKHSGLAVCVRREGMTPEEAHEQWVWSRAKSYKDSLLSQRDDIE